MAATPGPGAPTAWVDAPFGRFHLSIMILCGLVIALDGFDTQAIAYVAPSIGEAWGLDKSAFGPIFGVGLAGLTVGTFVLSPVADRIGRRAVILACTGLFGLFSLVTATATSVDQLLLYRFLTGIGLGGVMPNLIAVTNEYAPMRLRATLVTTMFCGFPLGATLGGALSAPLIAKFGWPSVFLFGGSLPLVLLPFLARYLPDAPRFLALRPDGPEKLKAIMRKIDQGIDVDAYVSDIRLRRATLTRALSALDLFRDGQSSMTVKLWLAFFMNLMVMFLLVNWLPVLARADGLPQDVAIASTTILNLGGVAGGIVMGRLIDRWDPARVLCLSYIAAAVFIGMIAWAGRSPVGLLAGAALVGFPIVGGQICLNAIAATSYPDQIRTTGVGWALGIGRIGSIVGPTLGGVLLSAGWSGQSLIAATILPTLIASAIVIQLRTR